MMRIYHWLFYSAITAASVVHELTTETFDVFVTKHELSLISFVAPWCSHCQELRPEFETAADTLQVDNLPLGRVDCDQQKELCERFQIPIYPTIFAFLGEDHLIYNGPRKSSSMVGFMKRYSQPLITELSTIDQVTEFKAKDNITIVGFFGEEDKQARDLFTTIAEMYRDIYSFGMVSDIQFGKTKGIASPAFVLYKNFDERERIFEDVFSIEKIEDFLEDMAVPLVREIGVDLELAHAGHKHRPVGWIFAETSEERARLASEIKPVAESTRGQMLWITASGSENEDHAVKLALEPGKWPAFAIQDSKNDFKFAYPVQGSTEAINLQTVKEITERLLAGGLQSSVMSEPIPTDQQGPVTQLVANTYQDLVMDNDRDILVFFSSPTCRHCEAMAATYNELGGLLGPISSHLTVAKIDAVNNDVWPRVTSYPTLKLYKSGFKDEPIAYEGNRTVDDFVKFVKENAGDKTAELLKDILGARAEQSLHDEL